MSNKKLVHTFSRTTANAAGTEIDTGVAGFAQYDQLTFYATLTGVTGGTLNVVIQTEIAANVWADWCSFTQLAAGGAARTYAVTTTPSATIATVGVGTTAVPGVALAAGSCVGGHPGDKLRVIYTSGAGASTGAAQTIRVVGMKLD